MNIKIVNVPLQPRRYYQFIRDDNVHLLLRVYYLLESKIIIIQVSIYVHIPKIILVLYLTLESIVLFHLQRR